MPNYQITIIVALCIASVLACAISWVLIYRSTPTSTVPAVVLSGFALLVGLFGLSNVHMTASRTVNGRIQWKFNSDWLFLTVLVMAALTLTYALVKHLRSGR